MVLGRRCGSVALLDEPCTRANLSPHCMTRPGVRRRGLPAARLRSSATSWLDAQRRTPVTSEPRKSSRSTCDFARMGLPQQARVGESARALCAHATRLHRLGCFPAPCRRRVRSPRTSLPVHVFATVQSRPVARAGRWRPLMAEVPASSLAANDGKGWAGFPRRLE